MSNEMNLTQTSDTNRVLPFPQATIETEGAAVKAVPAPVRRPRPTPQPTPKELTKAEKAAGKKAGTITTGPGTMGKASERNKIRAAFIAALNPQDLGCAMKRDGSLILKNKKDAKNTIELMRARVLKTYPKATILAQREEPSVKTTWVVIWFDTPETIALRGGKAGISDYGMPAKVIARAERAKAALLAPKKAKLTTNVPALKTKSKAGDKKVVQALSAEAQAAQEAAEAKILEAKAMAEVNADKAA